jgi:capsular exopolysaccharide synthesis family protein
MSRTFEALKKAEAEAASARRPPLVNGPVDGREAPHIRWDSDGYAGLEYERIGVLVQTPALGKSLRTLVVTACRRGGGATTTATVMAATLASSKRCRVLLVDANFRSSSLDLVFGVNYSPGLTDVLHEGKPEDTCIQPSGRENLFLLTTGRIPRHPSGTFDRASLERFIERTTATFDFVIFDTAPVLQGAETCALAACTDGAFLVLHADRTSVDDARKAKTELERVDARVVGAVLNRFTDYRPRFIQRAFSTS